MDTLLLFGIIILIVVIISFILISIKLRAYSVKHNSTAANSMAGWCESVSAGAALTLVIGLIIFFFPHFLKWDIRPSKKGGINISSYKKNITLPNSNNNYYTSNNFKV
jgi:hypothetical protein